MYCNKINVTAFIMSVFTMQEVMMASVIKKKKHHSSSFLINHAGKVMELTFAGFLNVSLRDNYLKLQPSQTTLD